MSSAVCLVQTMAAGFQHVRAATAEKSVLFTICPYERTMVKPAVSIFNLTIFACLSQARKTAVYNEVLHYFA